MNKSAEVDAYIATFPKPVQSRLKKVRAVIRKAAPEATELISYRIPAYKLHRILVFFAGFKGHIGLFPPVRGNATLQRQVASYAGPKGNLRFPHEQLLPLQLISRIVRFKIQMALANAGKPKRKPQKRKKS
jgi:uncharacterized protein YdhG (YjbR/CyaY superfamily)